MADALRTMGVTLRLVTEGEAKQIFADRVSDFILSRVMATGASTVSDTIVDSRRKGDTVLYAMGYFFSTGLACGTSTPATVQLPPGRYSFGIMNHGVPDFEPVVWSIPTADGHVDLKKPTLVEGSRT
jgi:hypothetical protein